jgi:DNA repair and recombination protein RAD52
MTPAQIEMLKAKLDPSAVKSREQAGRRLSYIEGWFAIAEANRIFGFDAWDRETVEIKCVAERERKIGRPPNERSGWGVSYIAKVRVTVGEIVREGVGAGHGIDADPGQAHESAIKEAETDAMKRALMTFGNPFGLALYDKTMANVGQSEEPANDRSAEAAAYLTELRDAINAQTDPLTFREWWADQTRKIPSGLLTQEQFDSVKADALKRLRSIEQGQKAA